MVLYCMILFWLVWYGVLCPKLLSRLSCILGNNVDGIGTRSLPTVDQSGLFVINTRISNNFGPEYFSSCGGFVLLVIQASKQINYRITNQPTHLFLLPSSVPVSKFSTSQFELRWTLLSLYGPTHPTWASLLEALLDYLGCWNLVWRLFSAKQGQLAN